MRYMTQLIVTFFLCMTLLGFLHSRSLHADTALVLPFYTHHVQYQGDKEYNEGIRNLSIGIETSYNGYTVGTTYVHKNSHNKKSSYSYGLKMDRSHTIHYGGGALLAIGGYDEAFIVAPVLSAQWEVLRIVTTIPFGAITQNDIDLVNIQLILPF